MNSYDYDDDDGGGDDDGNLHELIVGAPEDVHLHLEPVDVLTLDSHVHRTYVHLGAGHF